MQAPFCSSCFTCYVHSKKILHLLCSPERKKTSPGRAGLQRWRPRAPHRLRWLSQASPALALSRRAFLRYCRSTACCRARSSSPLRHCSTTARLEPWKALELPKSEVAALHWGQSRVSQSSTAQRFDGATKTKKPTNPEKEPLRLFQELVLPGCRSWPGCCSLQSCSRSPCGADSPKVTTDSRCGSCAVTACDLLAEIPS